MRSTNLFTGLAILTIAGSAAFAQSRIYSGGSSDHQRSDNSRSNMSSPIPSTGSNGIPAASTSSTATNFNRPIFKAEPSRRDHDHDHDRDRHFRCMIPEGCSAGQYVYYPYAYPPDDTTNYSDQQQQQPTEQAAPEAPAPTIFENRPGYTAPPIKSYHSISPASQTANADPTTDHGERSSAGDPQPTTILVFRDGHQLEIGNYAIVGDTLYNIAGGNDTHKILLADLDLDKTIKANQERGYEFRLPKRLGSGS